MNFQELYKKIADLDKPVSEECGMSPDMSQEPPTAPPSVSINMNAQGMDNIESLLKLVSKVNPDMPEPSMTDPIIKIGMPDQDNMNPVKPGFENSPNEQYADIDDVTVNAGGGMNGPKHPKDIRIKDPTPYENEAYENEPNEKYDDHLKIIKHLSGGMNREKAMIKRSYKQGDNPMAMPEGEDLVSSIKAELRSKLKEYKER